MNATRLYTLKYGRQERGVPPLSIGRVQTPTLALIVRRGEEIANFKPEPYWVLTTRYRDTVFTAVMDDPNEDEATASETGDGKKSSVSRRGYTDEAEARAALERIKESPFTVTGVTKKNGTEAPPRLFDPASKTYVSNTAKLASSVKGFSTASAASMANCSPLCAVPHCARAKRCLIPQR